MLFRSIANADTTRTTVIASETELSDVLRPYGLRGPHVSATDVRAEAQRRIIAVTGASDLMTCIVKQLNANMRANELNDKRVGGADLTAAEDAEATALRGLADQIKQIRAASNVMEPSPPSDYESDQHWALE